jgi:hypothetical protein
MALGAEMKHMTACLLLLSMPCLADEVERQLLERVAAVGKAFAFTQWQALFCRNQQVSRTDEYTVRSFTSSKLIAFENKPYNSTHELTLCKTERFADEEKEFCLIFFVAKENGKLCLVNP